MMRWSTACCIASSNCWAKNVLGVPQSRIEMVGSGFVFHSKVRAVRKTKIQPSIKSAAKELLNYGSEDTSESDNNSEPESDSLIEKEARFECYVCNEKFVSKHKVKKHFLLMACR